jgi:hypothetical protein
VAEAEPAPAAFLVVVAAEKSVAMVAAVTAPTVGAVVVAAVPGIMVARVVPASRASLVRREAAVPEAQAF